MLARICALMVIAGLAFLAAAQPASQPAGEPASQAASLPSGAVVQLGEVVFMRGGNVESLAFSPDGNMLLTTGTDSADSSRSSLRLWDARTGREIRCLGTTVANSQSSARFAGGRIVALGEDGQVASWDAATGKPTGKLPGVSGLFTCSADGKVIAWSEQNPPNMIVKMASLLDANTARKVGDGMFPQLSPDASKMVTMNMVKSDNRHFGAVAVLKNLAANKDIRKFDFGRSIAQQFQAVFSPDGKRLALHVGPDMRGAGTERSKLHVCDAADGNELFQAEGCLTLPRSIAWSPDGKLLALAGVNDMTVVDANSGKPLDGWPKEITDAKVAFSPDSKTLAVAASPEGIALYDLATGIRTVPGAGLLAVAWSKDGNTVATLDGQGVIARWPGAGGKPISRLQAATQPVSAALSNDAGLAALTGPDGPVHVYDLAAQKELRLVPTSGPAECLALSADGNRLAISQGNAAGAIIHLWDALAGKDLASNPLGGGDTAVSLETCTFSRDLACFGAVGIITSAAPGMGQQMQALVMDTATGAIRVLSAAARDGGAMASFAFSSANDLVAVGTSHGTVVVELATDTELFAPAQAEPNAPSDASHRLQVMSPDAAGDSEAPCRLLAFSHDGRLLAAYNTADGLIVSDLAMGKDLVRFGELRGRPSALAFSHDARRLATASEDGTATIWAVPAAAAIAPPANANAWALLTAAKADKAYPALFALAAGGDQTVTLFKDLLKPAAAVNRDIPRQVRQLVADMDSDDFDTRDKANKQLQTLGEQAEPTLKEILESASSDEVKSRIEGLLAHLDKGTVTDPELVRSLRAVSILERIGTPAAAELLARLAAGDPASRLTAAARAALARTAAK